MITIIIVGAVVAALCTWLLRDWRGPRVRDVDSASFMTAWRRQQRRVRKD